MSEAQYIYTVEHGEYSDHQVHGFCTSVEEAGAVARAYLAKRAKEYREDEREYLTPGSYNWPKVFRNPVNTPVSYMFGEKAVRVKWCEEDTCEL
jgi:hypothetical protein